MLGTCLSVFLFIISAESLNVSHLNGKHFRIGYYDIPYQISKQVNERNETVVVGFSVDQLNWMAVRGNFTYTFVLLPEILVNADLPAAFESKNLDWVQAYYGLKNKDNTVVQYFAPVEEASFSVIIPYPKTPVNVYSVTLPYTLSVWACFFASMTVVTFLLNCFARAKKYIYQHQENDSFLSYEGAILYVVGVTTNQGASCFSKARTVRLLAGIWCLVALVMVNAYSGSLITYVMAPNFKPLIKSIRDIDNKSEPQILYTSTAVDSTNDVEPKYQWLRQNLLQVPNDFCGMDFEDTERNEHCLTLVKEGRHVYVTDTWVAEQYVHEDFKKTGTCALTLAVEKLPVGYVSNILPLDSPQEFRNAIDILILEMQSYGLTSEQWGSAYAETPRYCKKYKTMDDGLRKLTLKDLAAAFVILGAGIAIGLTVFAYEVVRGRLLPQQASKQSWKPAEQTEPNQKPKQTTPE